MMDELIGKFIRQLEEGIIISDSSKITKPSHSINNVFIAGMGGSGIAGRFTATMMDKYGTVPVFTSNGYDIPNWVDVHTLVIVSSYSGNTEEALASFDKLKEEVSKIISITSGGRLLEISNIFNLDVVKMPSGWPSPRACFGYSFIAQLYVMFKLGLLKLELSKELSAVVDLLLNEQEYIKSEAKEISERIWNKFPFIYSGVNFEPVSIRFKQQLNENSKLLAHHAVIPEMNHNELVGWAKDRKDIAIVFLKSDSYSERINKRIELTKEIVIKYVDTIIEIEAKGGTLLQQLFYLVNLTDWVSWFVADKSNVDSMSIDNIDYLKNKLAEI